MKTIVKPTTLNGKPAWIKRNKSGNYWATVSGLPKQFETFGDAVRHVEKSTGVNYPL